MKNFLKQTLRAMYQFIVVGIILLPLRLIMLVYGLLYGLMAPGSDITIGEYYESILINIKDAYRRRALWIKYGDEFHEKYFD